MAFVKSHESAPQKSSASPRFIGFLLPSCSSELGPRKQVSERYLLILQTTKIHFCLKMITFNFTM